MTWAFALCWSCGYCRPFASTERAQVAVRAHECKKNKPAKQVITRKEGESLRQSKR